MGLDAIELQCADNEAQDQGIALRGVLHVAASKFICCACAHTVVVVVVARQIQLSVVNSLWTSVHCTGEWLQEHEACRYFSLALCKHHFTCHTHPHTLDKHAHTHTQIHRKMIFWLIARRGDNFYSAFSGFFSSSTRILLVVVRVLICSLN